MSYSRNDAGFRELLPFAVALFVPLAICVLVMFVETGIERAFFYAAVKVGVILVALGLALSFVASRFAASRGGVDGAPRP